MPKTQYVHNDKNTSTLSLGKGEILSEFFEISDKAREGGMGDVFFCRDKRDNKFYVLKTSSKTSNTDEQLFTKECNFVLRLWKHPYVAYAKTVLSDAEHLYIVMKFVGKQPYNLQEAVQGETLARVMNKTQIEPKQALIWAIQFCRGMQFLNNAGMESHKDIKPDNILITSQNDIKITDFGLAGAEKKGGTVGYRPPEYFSKEGRLTVASDIYSFGLVLYQMLNGNKPLPNVTKWDEDAQRYEYIRTDSIQSVHCQDIITKCLADNPDDRYQNFYELEKDLSSYLKKHYSEYVFPKKTKEKMTASDYFLKGLGYYQLKENLWAFLLFSLAIFEDPKMAEAYYYRSKIKLLPNGISQIIIIVFLLTLCSMVYYTFSDSNSMFLGEIRWRIFYCFVGLMWLIYELAKEMKWRIFRVLKFSFKNIIIVLFGLDSLIYKKLKNDK